MNMSYDEFKKLENKLTDKVLYFALSPDYKTEVERAKNFFTEVLNENNYSYDEKNFVSWLLWDYSLENGRTFFQEYIHIKGSELTDEENIIIEGLSNTYLSIYESNILNGKKKLTDVFLKEEFLLEESKEVINMNELIIGRVISFNGQNYLLDDYLKLDKRFQGGIEKIFHEKHEMDRNRDKFYTVKKFLENNPILLYSFANIIDDLTRKQIEDNNDYTVYQSTYVVINYKRLYDILYNNGEIDLEDKEDNILYFTMYDEGRNRILCEIVLYKEKLEIECISEIDKTKAKRTLEKLSRDLIKHVKDEILTIEDIL
ncbi:hypothetical protein R9X47_29025 [Wukongibacter baidiensis]|uniref:hypothetical protein n=1 Tax=Wukongibacter baidiensis TaxID=1723361 RepID=UPI003D7F3A3C